MQFCWDGNLFSNCFFLGGLVISKFCVAFSWSLYSAGSKQFCIHPRCTFPKPSKLHIFKSIQDEDFHKGRHTFPLILMYSQPRFLKQKVSKYVALCVLGMICQSLLSTVFAWLETQPLKLGICRVTYPIVESHTQESLLHLQRMSLPIFTNHICFLRSFSSPFPLSH